MRSRAVVEPMAGQNCVTENHAMFTVAPTESDVAVPTAPIRILLVDDDEDMPVLVRASLDADQYVVEWVADYDGAIKAARSKRFDALLIDYRLGDRNGILLLAELQARGHRAAMIVLTSSDDGSVDAAALGAGAADLILKRELTQSRLERSIRYARGRSTQVAALQGAADAAGRDANIDAPTGLGNRRAFDLDLADLVAHHRPGGLVLADVDGLKTINDELGHARGDAAISLVAENLREGRRATDSTYRIGGDEMAVIVSGRGTAELGLKLQRTMARMPGAGFVVSASIGWAEGLPDDTITSLFARADANLYSHKRARRASL